MNVMELGAIGELVGGLAVIGSLIFVGLQVRQNNRLVADSVAHAARHIADEWLRDLSTDPTLAELYLVGLEDRTRLPTAEQRIRFDMILLRLFRTLESLFLEHIDGHLSDEVWRATERTFDPIVRQPGGAESWRRQKSLFAERFAKYVDRKLAGVNAAEA